MRVVHLYGGNLYGGVERLLVELSRHSHAITGLDQQFGLCFPGRLAKELEAEGAAVHWLGRVRASRPWQVVAARRRLQRWLRDERFDVAICHSWWPYAMFAPAARAAGGRVALWAHDAATGRGWLERWAARRKPDVLICCSRTVGDSLARLYGNLDYHIVAPPVPPPAEMGEDVRRGIRAQMETGAETVVILQASRLEPWKGHTLLLEAVARLPAELDWTVWIAGGAQRPREAAYLTGLKDRAERLGLRGRVQWLGQRSDVGALMGAADIFCQPNTGDEPFGIVFVEALGAGLPVVTTARGGGQEIVTGECGRRTAADAAAVSDALLELIRSPTLRRQLGEHGRQRARQLCDPRQQILKLRQVLEADS